MMSFASTSSVQTTGGVPLLALLDPSMEVMLFSKTFVVPAEPVKNPPSVVTSDQPFFDPGTSTSGLSSGMTVGGTGSSLVLPSVVTSDRPFFDPGTSTSGLSSGMTVGGTGSSLVQTTSSAQTASCGHTEIQQGLPVKQDYQLQGIAGDTGIS